MLRWMVLVRWRCLAWLNEVEADLPLQAMRMSLQAYHTCLPFGLTGAVFAWSLLDARAMTTLVKRISRSCHEAITTHRMFLSARWEGHQR